MHPGDTRDPGEPWSWLPCLEERRRLRQRLGPFAWLVWEVIGEHAVDDGQHSRRRRLAPVTGNELGVSKNVVHRAVRILRSEGLITIEQSHSPEGHFSAGGYRLLPPNAGAGHTRLVRPTESAPRSPSTRSRGRPWDQLHMDL